MCKEVNMTVDNLISNYRQSQPKGHFFDPDTLKFFGERYSEMRVLKELAEKTDYSGKKHKCYVLSSYQRKAPGGPRRAYHYFDAETFRPIND
jgi:hypothetical protein